MNIEMDVLERPKTLSHGTVNTPPACLATDSIDPLEVPIPITATDSWASDLDYAAVAGASSIIVFKLFLLGLLLFAI